jgi:DNA-binding transcriptional ArsR family regulator
MVATTPRRAGPRTVSIEVAPAFEFLATLAVHSQLADRETYEIGTGWFESIERAAGSELVERALNFSARNDSAWLHLVPFAYEAGEPRNAGALIEHLRGIEPREIALHLVGYYQRHVRRETEPEVIAAAVDGDPGARKAFLTSSFPEWEPWRTYLERMLEQDPDALKRELLAILEAWAASVWSGQERQVMPILERDAEAKRELVGTMPLERFIEVATNGISYVARPEIRRVLLVPSYVSRPWVSHIDHHDVEILLYPVADESVSAETDAPPLRLLRLSKALADEKRLRILRTLASGEMTLMQLAESFGVPKTTMHHHLIQLRSAGLVSVEMGTKRYRLRHDVLPDVAQLLAGYLGGAAPDAAADGGRPTGQGGAAGGQRRGTAGNTRPARRTENPSRRRRPR